METLSVSQKLAMGLIGPLYGFLYSTSRSRLMGITLAGWLKFLSLLFAFVALIMDWSDIWIYLGVLLTIGLILLYWKAKRVGYIRFVTNPEHAEPTMSKTLMDDERVPLLATGFLSTSHREDYVLKSPSEYWRDKNGELVIMAEFLPRRYLYQFIQPGTIQHIESGYLLSGTKPLDSLKITFLTTWAPELGDQRITMYSPRLRKPKSEIQRTIYLSFNNSGDEQAVWKSLLHDT